MIVPFITNISQLSDYGITLIWRDVNYFTTTYKGKEYDDGYFSGWLPNSKIKTHPLARDIQTNYIDSYVKAQGFSHET